MRFVIWAVIVVIIAIALALLLLPTPIDDLVITSCSADSDCIAARADCCGCSYGGKAKAINKEYSGYWDGKVGSCMCPAVISNHISCLSDAKCVNSKCQLVPNPELVCDSGLLFDCRDRSGDIEINGISCEEVKKMCETSSGA
ncbi:MAG: hypothetical protein ISS93_01920 [Candidatus Aenigmarchaeota archaeon]|nr:hypothetical protein [Candidatus Aenigmarchaeota archaeon]